MIRRKRPKRQSERGAWNVALDKLCRLLVIHRDGCCVRCGNEKGLAAAHIMPKGRVPRLRFEWRFNIIALCVGCHLFFCHKDPLGFTAWLESKYPGRHDQLRQMAAVAPKVDVKTLYIVLKAECDELPIAGSD